MAEEAREHLEVQAAALAEVLPADVMARPVGELAPAEALGRAALAGLHQLIRIIETPLPMLEAREVKHGKRIGVIKPGPEDLKLARLIGDMSLGAGKLYMAALDGFNGKRRNDVLERLAELMESERQK